MENGEFCASLLKDGVVLNGVLQLSLELLSTYFQ
jgi:hypothetical protein